MYDGPNYRRIMDRIRLEAALQETMDDASEVMALEEVFDKIKSQGETYECGYYTGWWASLEFYNERNQRRGASVRKKYLQLYKLWRLYDSLDTLK